MSVAVSKSDGVIIDKYLIKPANKTSYSIYRANNAKKHLLSLSVYDFETEDEINSKILDTYPNEIKKIFGNGQYIGIQSFNIDYKKTNSKWNNYNIIFMPSKNRNGLTNEEMKKIFNDYNNKKIKECKYYAEKEHDECINTTLDILKNGVNNVGVFYIKMLMLNVKDTHSICHNIPGAIQIYTAEQYFKSRVNGRLVGHLYDAARKYVSEICTTLQEIYSNKQITQDYMSFLIKLTSTAFYSSNLSASTVARTGLTYYEKFGYMSGIYSLVNENKVNDTLAALDYTKCFNVLLDVIEFRLDILNIKLKDILTSTNPVAGAKSSSTSKKTKKAKSQSSKTKKTGLNKKDKAANKDIPTKVESQAVPNPVYPGKIKYSAYNIKKLWKALPKIKYLCRELKPDYKFKLDTVLDLYNIIDSRKHDLDFFCKGNKKYSYTKALLMYVLLYRIVYDSYTNLFSDYQSDDKVIQYSYSSSTHVKLLRIENTEANQFILEQHARLPAVKKEYLADLSLEPVAGKNNKLSCEMRKRLEPG